MAKNTYVRDEDRAKEDLIKELEYHRQARLMDDAEIARLQNRVDALIEELTYIKHALAYNCEALKTAIGWKGFDVKGDTQ